MKEKCPHALFATFSAAWEANPCMARQQCKLFDHSLSYKFSHQFSMITKKKSKTRFITMLKHRLFNGANETCRWLAAVRKLPCPQFSLPVAFKSSEAVMLEPPYSERLPWSTHTTRLLWLRTILPRLSFSPPGRRVPTSNGCLVYGEWSKTALMHEEPSLRALSRGPASSSSSPAAIEPQSSCRN